MSSTLTFLASTTPVPIDCNLFGMTTFQFDTVESGFVFTVEGTVNGTNWVTLTVYDHSNTTYAPGSAITAVVGTVYRVNSSGFVKIRITNASSKTASGAYAFQDNPLPFDLPTKFYGAASWTNMPNPGLLIWEDWRNKLFAVAEGDVSTSQATVYHFSQAGDDSTGNGSASTPYKTVAKAQTLMANGVELRFRFGDIWKESAGFTISSRTGLIIRGYAFGGRTAADGAPIISKFSADYNSTWTLTGGQTKTYQRTDLSASTIAWMREKNDIGQSSVLRRMTSIAEVEAMEGSWWSSGTVVYIHPWGDLSPATNGRVYESVQKNTIDGCYITSASSNILIEDMRFDGWGCNPDSASAFYGIRVETTEWTRKVVVRRCEAYYNGRHNLGLVSAGNGCQIMFKNCSCGWSTPTGDNPFVDYAGNGAQRALWDNIKVVAGNLPSFTSSTGTCYPYGSGCPAYVSHGGTDTSMSIVNNTIIVDGPYCCGWHGSMQNAPAFTNDISLCRAFVSNTQLRLRDKKTVYELNDPWSNSVGMSLQSQGDPNTLHINCHFDCRCWGRRGGAANGVSIANAIKGYYVNCTFDCFLDLDSHSSTGGYRPFFWNGIANEVAFFWNCWFNFRTRGVVITGFEGQCASNNNVTFCSPNLKFRNCVFTAQVANGALFYLAVNNNRDAAGVLQTGTARSLLNNAYGCNAGKTDTYRGYDQDPYLIEIPTNLVMSRAGVGTNLKSSNTQPLPGGVYLQYDQDWKPRSTTSSAVGPWEANV